MHLLYLRSWQGMGQARVECASGCSCEETVLDAHWDREATLTDLTTLKVNQCMLSCRGGWTVTCNAAGSGGRACRVRL